MEKKRGIDSFTLHILAMLFMLCDHLWATLFPAQEWMTCVGRLAFPIFAFMIAEGCYYTSNVKKYMLRLFLFAIISEIPFNLIMGSSVFYPFHQNVLWTFLLGVLSIQIIEKAKKKQKKWISFFVVCLVLLMDFLLGTITMVDYNAAGIHQRRNQRIPRPPFGRHRKRAGQQKKKSPHELPRNKKYTDHGHRHRRALRP